MKRKTPVKPDLTTKAGKYFLAKQKGMNKSEAALSLGIDPRNVNKLEKTEMYQAIEKRYFKDDLLGLISLQELASELKKNIVQDDDRGAKNKAIEIALSKLEPEKVKDDTENERVLVILKE